MMNKIKPKYKVPGEILQKHIKTGAPKLSGYYLCFTDSKEAWTDVYPIARLTVIFYNMKKWASSTPVLAWIGPLPVLSLDELHSMPPNEAGIYLYYIGTQEQADNFSFKNPPFYESITARLSPGKKGQFIYLYNTRMTGLKKLYKYSENKEKWSKLKVLHNINSSIPDIPPKQAEPREFSAPIYAVATKKQVALGKWPKGKTKDYVKAWGGLYKSGDILWEIKDQKIIPTYIWKNGWAGLSDFQIKRTLRVIKIIKRKNKK